MITTPRRGFALASCLTMSFWSLALLSGPNAQAAPATSGILAASDTGATSSAFSLTLSPTRLAVDQANLGKVQQIRLSNGGSVPVSIRVQKRNFSGATNGTLTFQDNAPYSAASWVTASPMAFTVQPGATQVVTASITVPQAPETGDHQVALVFLVPAGATTANVKINRGIGMPMYITVPGPIDDSAMPSNLTAPGFATGGPIHLGVTVKNVGTVHRDFRGPYRLHATAAGAATSFPDFTVMRGSTRTISTTWNPPLMCICHPNVTITDADGTKHTVSVRVIVLPLPLLGAVLGGLAVLVLMIYVLRRRYRATVLRAAAAMSPPVSGGHA